MLAGQPPKSSRAGSDYSALEHAAGALMVRAAVRMQSLGFWNSGCCCIGLYSMMPFVGMAHNRSLSISRTAGAECIP